MGKAGVIMINMAVILSGQNQVVYSKKVGRKNLKISNKNFFSRVGYPHRIITLKKGKDLIVINQNRPF